MLEWRKNNSYFYFPFLISNCVMYSIEKIFAKGTAKQKIFRGRSEVLKFLYFLQNDDFFFASNHHCYNCFLYFDCLWKHVQKNKPLYKYLELAQELRKLVLVAKKKLMNFLSSLLTRNKIRLDVKKKSLFRLPFVTRVLDVAQEFFESKNLKSHYFRVTKLFHCENQ